MSRLFSLIFCFVTLFCFAQDRFEEKLIVSSPEQLATIYSESTTLVGGLVSPLSGQLSLKQTDLVIKGAQSLAISHLYIPPSIPSSLPKHKQNQEEWNKFYLAEHLKNSYKGWVYLPHLLLERLFGNQVRVTDANGATLDFAWSNSSKTKLVTEPYAIHNTSGDIPSGKYDPRNTQITWDNSNHHFVVISPDGTTKLYGDPYSTFSGRILFRLLKEILPNGKIIRYSYERTLLKSIEAKDPKEQFTYAKITIDNKLTWPGGSYFFKSPSTLSAEYSYTRRSLRSRLKKNPFTGKKVNFFEWDPPLPLLLTGVSSPFFRSETFSYDQNFLLKSGNTKDFVFECDYGSFGSENKEFKLQTLSLPVGPNESFHPTYTFEYNSPIAGKSPGHTLVKKPDGTFLLYHFSKNLLVTSIQWLDENKALQKQKLFSWTNAHYLSQIIVQDGTGLVLYKKTFDYDSFGNPIRETLHGNLTGNDSNETYVITRKFSTDEHNLILEETTEEGKIITWDYLPGTNLVTAKLTKDHEKILLREFYNYDNCYNLIAIIHDDGSEQHSSNLSNVTQRTIKEYHLIQQEPYLHLPEWTTEKFLENGEEKLLTRTHFIYDSHGNVEEERVYENNDALAYTLHKTYNERGNILSATNALGDSSTYNYDEKGRLFYQSSLSKRLDTKFSYDKHGRLKKKEEQGEKVKHTYSYEYDLFDRLIAKIDPLKNQTSYSYDSLSNQVSQTSYPHVESISGPPTPVETYTTYDALARPLIQVDANGNATESTYNAYNAPTHVLYADGSEELSRYFKNGQLASHTDPDGLTIQYERDVLGRVLSKTYLSKSYDVLAQETFRYSSFHLLSHTNKEGNTKTFSYDGAGRKIREEYGDKIIHYAYNHLGFLEKTTHENGSNTLVLKYEKDALGQILKEEKCDITGNVFYKKTYTYDADGNQITTSRFINNAESQDSFEYDSFGRLISHTDAAGALTTHTYDESHTNAIGQKVLQHQVTDPLHVSKIKTMDAFRQVAMETTRNVHGQIIASHQNIHDPAGNCTHRKDVVYLGYDAVDSHITKWTFNSRNQLSSLTRGTNDTRKTSYEYTPGGKLQIQTNPDHISLNYTYDGLGFLQSVTSSDDQINHTFVYDKEGNLLAAIDANLNLSILREVDPFGNITKELFPHALIEKDYDALDRSTTLELDGIGSIHYDYDPLYLRKVTRNSSDNFPQYSHNYLSYDLNGNLLSEEMIHELGITEQSFDIQGQKIAIHSPYLNETASYDPCHNLLTKISDSQVYEYTYDSLDQLTSENDGKQLTSYTHDSIHNLREKNHQNSEINHLNELRFLDGITYDYDLNGNQTLKQTIQEEIAFTYDPLNRLTSAKGDNFSVVFLYDPLGRRLSKKVTQGHFESTEYYLYDGADEIGAITQKGELKNLKVLGGSFYYGTRIPIAIELGETVFAPILDLHNNTRKLIDPYAQIRATYQYSTYGEQKAPSDLLNPWCYFSKRLDPETGLINFGKRYYDPHHIRWLSTDPAGFVDSINLYQYALNNPFKYYDPNGETLLGFVGGLVQIIAGGAVMASGFAIEVATFGGYTFALGVHEATGLALMMNGCRMAMHHAQDLSTSIEFPNTNSMDWNTFKTTDVYFPDRELPRDKDGIPIPEVSAPHTQLGKRNGSQGPYPQAREFDENGNPVREIDFTDHGTPNKHPNPHQHRREENPTGGTRTREGAEPLPEWKYL